MALRAHAVNNYTFSGSLGIALVAAEQGRVRRVQLNICAH
jgi:hypothetical protein